MKENTTQSMKKKLKRLVIYCPDQSIINLDLVTLMKSKFKS